jgi:predicted transposase YdaD
MQEYDAALKLLLQASTNSLLRQATGLTITHWLNAELPKLETTRADLLGMTDDNILVHVELQSTNDSTMAFRMVDYALRIYSHFDQFPKQIVLYVGKAPLRMQSLWREPDSDQPDFLFRYNLVDIRDLDANLLLASPRIEDNVLAILTHLQNQAATVRQILERIASLEPPQRRSALAQLLVISKLRDLAKVVQEETRKMPILDDIMDHDVLGPVLRQGRNEGRKEGRQEGREEAARSFVRRSLEQRFKMVPSWVEARLTSLNATELDTLFDRIPEASAITDLFPDSK